MGVAYLYRYGRIKLKGGGRVLISWDGGGGGARGMGFFCDYTLKILLLCFSWRRGAGSSTNSALNASCVRNSRERESFSIHEE